MTSGTKRTTRQRRRRKKRDTERGTERQKPRERERVKWCAKNNRAKVKQTQQTIEMEWELDYE